VIEEEVLYGLETRVIGRHLHCHDTVGSTNDLAADLAAQGAPEGTVVLAEQQTAGRGREGRRWHSPPRVGITLSCVLRPLLDPPSFWVVTACASVAVCRAVTAQTGLRPAVKKPNDVLVGGRKVCGILTEARRDALILGVGVSVNHGWEDFPEDLHDVATSLRIASGQKVDRIGLLRRVLKELDAGYEELKQDGGAAAIERWEKLSE
jgi:BirA family biotin operon repressor/biotin-[acetyl-CoA-carboxylase] ligase